MTSVAEGETVMALLHSRALLAGMIDTLIDHKKKTCPGACRAGHCFTGGTCPKCGKGT